MKEKKTSTTLHRQNEFKKCLFSRASSSLLLIFYVLIGSLRYFPFFLIGCCDNFSFNDTRSKRAVVIKKKKKNQTYNMVTQGTQEVAWRTNKQLQNSFFICDDEDFTRCRLSPYHVRHFTFSFQTPFIPTIFVWVRIFASSPAGDVILSLISMQTRHDKDKQRSHDAHTSTHKECLVVRTCSFVKPACM